MKPRQVFGLIVRVFGLIFILVGIVFAVSGLVEGIISPVYRDYFYNSEFTQIWRLILFGFSLALLGYFMIRCVRHIVRFAYPEDDHDT